MTKVCDCGVTICLIILSVAITMLGCVRVYVCLLVVMVAEGWGQAVLLGVGLVGEDEEEGESELVYSFTFPVTQQFQS